MSSSKIVDPATEVAFLTLIGRIKPQEPTTLDKLCMNLRSKSLLPKKAKVELPQSTSVGEQNDSEESEKYTRMKLRKEAKKDRAERKERTVTTDGDLENYDIDKVLRKLGEVSNKIKSHL